MTSLLLRKVCLRDTPRRRTFTQCRSLEHRSRGLVVAYDGKEWTASILPLHLESACRARLGNGGMMLRRAQDASRPRANCWWRCGSSFATLLRRGDASATEMPTMIGNIALTRPVLL